jgi:hypothetical protein
MARNWWPRSKCQQPALPGSAGHQPMDVEKLRQVVPTATDAQLVSVMGYARLRPGGRSFARSLAPARV